MLPWIQDRFSNLNFNLIDAARYSQLRRSYYLVIGKVHPNSCTPVYECVISKKYAWSGVQQNILTKTANEITELLLLWDKIGYHSHFI